jgi:hypothetical protein
MRPLIRFSSPQARDTHPRQTDDGPITLPELLARTIALWAADIAVAKAQAAQIERRRAALLAELLAEQAPTALHTEAGQLGAGVHCYG